jgi:catechol 2,3-dioxygenase-like lactoylglutathione lyase family enzyme
MVITGLLHVAIKTADLAATLAFYTKVLGLRETARPNFGYPGAWLAVPTPVGEAVIHIYAGGPALGPQGKVSSGTGAIDHVSITAVGWNAFRQRFDQFGLPWREFLIPNTTYWQLFVYDPSGVQLELTFDQAAENIPLPAIAEEKRYRAGESFFDPAVYAGFAERAIRCAA